MTGRTRTVQPSATPDISSELAEFRVALEQQRQLRLDQLGEFAVESTCAATAADEPHSHVAATVRATTQAALAGIDAARHRLRHGSDGTCGQCYTAIPLERQEAPPVSRSCMHCQHAAESTRPPATHRAAEAPPPLHQLRRSRGSGNGRAHANRG
jgi:RNA polymerase-binding transcription factor DksA